MAKLKNINLISNHLQTQKKHTKEIAARDLGGWVREGHNRMGYPLLTPLGTFDIRVPVPTTNVSRMTPS